MQQSCQFGIFININGLPPTKPLHLHLVVKYSDTRELQLIPTVLHGSGHWEGDLIAGSGNRYIATPVERHTRSVMLVKGAGKSTDAVVSALIRQAKKLQERAV